MNFSWRKSQRRKELLAEPFPAAWLEHLASNVRHYRYLEPSRQAVVQDVVQVFVFEKHWAGGAGLSVTEEMKVTIAAQASLLVLGFSQPYYYDHVPSIIVYPQPYFRPRLMQQGHIIIRDDWELCGEAWHRGPIVLSWEDVLASGQDAGNGHNLVLHEFAHHLDRLNGEFDGVPPLSECQYQQWYRITEAEYLRLVGCAERNEVTLLDQYGATNRVEFFAVATECFFEQPGEMRRLHEELYGALRDFYQQDPARWCPDATIQRHRQWMTRSDSEEIEVRQAELEAQLIASTDIEDFFMFGLECQNEKHYGLAVRAFSRVIELDPSDAEAYQQRAMARARLGEYTAALSDAQEALRLDDGDVAGYLARGAAFLGLRQYEQARKDLDRVVREEDNNAEAYYLRGLAWDSLGNLRRAVSDFSHSITLRPHDADAYYRRAHAYRRLGSSAKADADLEKAFHLDPQIGWRK